MEKEKKPFYKQAWWIVLLLVIIVVGKTTGVFDEKETVKKDKTEPIEKTNNNDRDENDTVEKFENNENNKDDNEENNGITTKEHDDELLFGEFTVKSLKIDVDKDDGIFTLRFYWINQSGEDKIPFTGVGYFDVYQGNELLQDISDAFNPVNNNFVLRKANNGIETPIEIEYELINDKPIQVKFGATHEFDDTKETVTFDTK